MIASVGGVAVAVVVALAFLVILLVEAGREDARRD